MTFGFRRLGGCVSPQVFDGIAAGEGGREVTVGTAGRPCLVGLGCAILGFDYRRVPTTLASRAVVDAAAVPPSGMER